MAEAGGDSGGDPLQGWRRGGAATTGVVLVGTSNVRVVVRGGDLRRREKGNGAASGDL